MTSPRLEADSSLAAFTRGAQTTACPPCSEFAACRECLEMRSRRAKPGRKRAVCGTTEVVPFQNSTFTTSCQVLSRGLRRGSA